MTTDEQLFPNEFIAQIIQVDLVKSFHLDLDPGHANTFEAVICTVEFGNGTPAWSNKFVGTGRTMGLAMKHCREKIREHYGS